MDLEAILTRQPRIVQDVDKETVRFANPLLTETKSEAALPLIILRSALWYKSVVALSLTPFLVCMTAVAVLPKTLGVIAACMVLGDFAALIVGFGILRGKRLTSPLNNQAALT